MLWMFNKYINMSQMNKEMEGKMDGLFHCTIQGNLEIAVINPLTKC